MSLILLVSDHSYQNCEFTEKCSRVFISSNKKIIKVTVLKYINVLDQLYFVTFNC